jgi:hypothetical protein
MNRKSLVLVAAICGLVLVLALLLFPITSTTFGDETRTSRAIEGETGPFLLIFAWLACGFAAIVLLGKADYIGIGDDKGRMLSLLGFKLAGFFFLAHLIAGNGEHVSWGFGFWLGFIASIVGAIAMYLTFNPALAAKIAEKAHELREKATSEDDKGDKPAGGDTPSSES